MAGMLSGAGSTIFAVCLGLAFFALGRGPGDAPPGRTASIGAGAATGAPTVSVDAGNNRILIRLSGRVDDTMASELGAALAGFRYESRPIVISINSASGFVHSGHRIIDLINVAKSGSDVHTRVGKGAVCASMCVPIYLAGSRRTAAPEARFMFHEARLATDTPEYRRLRQSTEGVLSRQELASLEKSVSSGATDGLFGRDMNYRDVNSDWLIRMRAAVRGGKDVWLTGQQLVDQGSGMVHALR